MTILIVTLYLQLSLLFRVKIKTDSFFVSLIKSGLIISFVIFSVTSILNLFSCIHGFSILISWILLNLILLIYTLSNLTEIILVVKDGGYNLKTKLKHLTTLKKVILLIVGIFLITLFVQGLMYPPTNWDSMTYHLPRVIQWINHGSLKYYPTHIVRQLYQPPFAEYSILHIIMLNKSDLFAFTIQFFYFLLVAITIIEITSFFSNRENIRWTSGLLCIFLPEAVLQATSTQNDIVVSFFITSSILFLLINIKKPTFFNFFFLGISIGLALLTKALAYVYLPVFIGMFFVFFIKKYFTKWNKIYFIWGGLTLTVVLLINIYHFRSNYALCNNIMGTDPKEDKEYKLEDRSFSGISSNLIKNIGLHMDPFFVGNLGNQLVEKIHIVMDFDPNKKGMNYIDLKYSSSPSWRNHEDTQPNFFHFLLGCTSFISIAIVFLRKTIKLYKISYYYLCVIISFLIFIYLLKWQPWNTRIHLPLFFLMIPAITIFSLNIKPKINLVYISLLILIPYCFYLSIFNFSRPLITKENLTSTIKCSDNRFKKYFANNIGDYYEYRTIIQKTLGPSSNNIGIHFHCDSWEYPLYYPLFENQNKIENILVKNYSAKYPALMNKYNFIISNLINSTTFKLKHYTYFNLTPNNNKIWLYKLQK